MSFERVDYTTVNGTKSSAYFNPETLEAWNVFTQAAVAIVQDPVTHLYTQWVPTPAVTHVANVANQPVPVVLRQQANTSLIPWMLIPIGLFGLGMIWLELTFLH